ncbi:hypothetical protein V6N13_073051 [Hibiscus sabdariffa]
MQGAAGGSDKGIERTNHKVDDEGSEGYKRDDVDDLYFVKVRYLSDGNDDEELQAGREKLKRLNEKSVINFEESKGDQERSEMNVQEDVEFEEEHEKGTIMEYCHDTKYYDSDDHGHLTNCSLEEEDDEYCAKMRSMFSVYNPNHENPEFCIGMLFKDGKEFKDAIRKYSKLSRRELKIIRNEPKRIRVKCLASVKCPWRIFASYSRATRCIQVKSFQDEHNCCVSFQNKMVNVAVIADHFEATIRDHPKMKLKEIQRRVASEIHVNVNLTRAKNPGSTIKMAVQRVTPNSPPHFKRFFVCFDSLKKGWKEGCRPILGLDGCFLKGPFKSELLLAVGRDANNKMYLVAWAIVEVECTDSWAWFLNLLAADLDLEDGFGFTIISDQQKGLEIVINDVLPRVEHRNCVRHVFANWIRRKKLKSYEFDFWEIVKATTERKWEDKFEALTQKDELVAKDLKSKSPKHWTKAFFGCHMKRKFDQNKKDNIEWNMIRNGDNGSEVKKGRKQYIVKLQDMICSCRSWQLTSLPCPHACCAIWHMGGDPDDYLDQCYHKNTYMKAYAYALHPINGADD